MKRTQFIFSFLTGCIILLSSCTKEAFRFFPGKHQEGKNMEGAVLIMDNAIAGNHVILYARALNGLLSAYDTYATGGKGTASGLGSQGSLVLSKNSQYLYACNAGSNDITVFGANSQGLTWIEKVASGGTMPVSLTVKGNLLYVLNAGGTGNISGFSISSNGHLTHLAGSDRPLSGPAAGPAQIQFNEDGNQLVVTEKATNMIITYKVAGTGLPEAGVAHPSVGNTPFGFAFGKKNQLFVSDAFEGAVTSYSLNNNGTLSLITGPVITHQRAACWVAVTDNGRYCYTTNAASANITGFRISSSGELSLLDPSGITGVTTASPTDLDLSKNSEFLYTLNANSNSISMFSVNQDNGSLVSLGTMTGIPTGSAGIVAE